MVRSKQQARPLAFAAALALASSGWAGVLLTENFNSYANGTELQVSGSPKWGRISGTAGDLLVSNPSGNGVALVHDNSSDDDVATLSTSVSSGLIYASFTLISEADRTSSTSGAESPISFYSSSGSAFGRVLPMIPGGTGSTSFRLGVADGGTGSATGTTGAGVGTVDLAVGSTHTIVLRYDLSVNQTTMWIDPVNESSTGLTATDAVSTPTINRFLLRQPSADTMGDFSIDNIVVATTFAEVVPEPVTVGIFAIAGALLARRRRR